MGTADILYLSGWTALDILERDDHYVIQAAPLSPYVCCPHCGSAHLLKHGTDRQQIRDLPIHGKGVVLCIDHQRYRCPECKRTNYQPLPAIDTKRQMTERLIRYIERKAISTNRTFASIAEEIGSDPRTVRNVFDDAVKRLDASVVSDSPRILGIDELHVLGAPRGILTDLENHTIIELLEDRKKLSIIHALRQFKQPERLCAACIDLWRPYREAIETVFPGAVIICDKFHVLQLVTSALERFRKEMSLSLTEAERRTLKMHDRYLLLRRLRDLSPEDRFLLESWTGSFPLLGQAHQLKEEFFAIYDQPDRSQAEAAYFAWTEHIPPELHHIYYPIMHTFEEWGDHVFAHFDTGVTGALVESANAVARCLNRMGRGYSLPVLRARLLYGMKRSCVDSPGKGIAISTVLKRTEVGAAL